MPGTYRITTGGRGGGTAVGGSAGRSVRPAASRGAHDHLVGGQRANVTRASDRDGRPRHVASAPMDDLEAMAVALDEARAALAHGDVPVGAVVLVDGEIIARRHNERELTGDPTAHAEVLALRDAAAARGLWRLGDATLVVTLEPCTMCAGAAINARVPRVVFGARDLKAGAVVSLYGIGSDPRLNHEFTVHLDVAADECAELLTRFFADRR